MVSSPPERLSAERPLLLGSASPRRREMLTAVGLPLAIVAPRADETVGPNDAPARYLERVTAAKLAAAVALARAATASFGAVLVADTVVVSEGGIIVDKPADAEAARRALLWLSGATHAVVTRFVIGAADGGVLDAESVVTRVVMRALTSHEVDAYVASREGLDKAGGYGIQGGAASFVTRLEGSYTNVVGLPLAEVLTALRSLGLWD